MSPFLNRREFLEKTLAGGGFLLAVTLFPFEARLLAAQAARKGIPDAFNPARLVADHIGQHRHRNREQV